MTAIDVRSLVVRRGDATILDSVSFAAGAGEFIGVIGRNGAGKSTLLRALAGLEPHAAGDVLLDAVPVASLKPRDRARRIAFLPQMRELHWAATAESVVALGRFAWGSPYRLGAPDRAAVDRAVAATDLEAFRGRIAQTLSGGEQARMHLARALAAETPTLIADEPTAALDLRHALAILRLLREKTEAGGLVVAALHDIDLAQRFCSRLVVLDRGRIAADGPAHAGLTPDVISSVFGVSADDVRRAD